MIFTHVIAALLGGAVWFSVRSEKEADGKTEVAEVSRKVSSRNEARRERTGANADGERVLAEISGEQPGQGRTEKKKFNYADYVRESTERVIRQADELTPADDVAAAAIAALEAQSGEPGRTLTSEMIKEMENMPARLLHWLRKDPEAAVAHLASLKAGMSYQQVLMAAISEKGPLAASKWVSGEGNFSRQLRYLIASQAGLTGDPALIDELRKSVPPDQWSQGLGMVSTAWPSEKKDEMFEFALAENKPFLLTAFATRQGVEGYEWLKAKLADENTDPAFKQTVLKDPNYRELIWNTAEIPFDERMEILSGYNKDKPREQLELELGGRDLTNFLNKGRDWRYALHTGNATMEEIYQAAAEALPEVAANSPGALRNQIYKEMAEVNAGAALASLDTMSGEEKWEMALKPARWMFESSNPDAFYDYIHRIPDNTSEALWQTRLEAWNEQAARSYRTLSGGYADWVLALPEGTDREMACYNLLKQVKDKDSELAVSLRASVKDPRLIERMSKKP